MDWSRCAIDSVNMRALKRGELTGPNPVDRGKKGSKIHLATEQTGLPLSVGISAANIHDVLGLEPLIRGIPPIRSRRGPRRRRPSKLHADKGYDFDPTGETRWTVERTVSWLGGFRRLHRRYEREAEHFLAFTGIAVAVICHRRLAE